MSAVVILVPTQDPARHLINDPQSTSFVNRSKDRRINNRRDFRVAITLGVMIANKNWTVIDPPILTCTSYTSLAERWGGRETTPQQGAPWKTQDGAEIQPDSRYTDLRLQFRLSLA